MDDSIQQRLRERVKELAALHSTARLLQTPNRDLDSLMPEFVALLPPAWQYPESTEGRVRWQERTWSTPGFRETDWRQVERFRLRDGQEGEITVVYTRACPPGDEGPFLREERDLIRSLAEMLRAFFQHRMDDASIVAANERLERQVAERTARLRRVTRELCLAEERERRRIAEDLHDHLGQALALMNMRLRQLRGDAVLSGHGRELDDLVSLSGQAIRYTRGLTFELSPPVLYELGLGSALEWLGERVGNENGLEVEVREPARASLPHDLRVMLWKCARELVHNVLKHADARKMIIALHAGDGRVSLDVTDDGRGFDPGQVRDSGGDHIGLASIEERLRDLGGHTEIVSAPGQGTRVRLTVPVTEIDR